jgi:hypothetical protein
LSTAWIADVDLAVVECRHDSIGTARDRHHDHVQPLTREETFALRDTEWKRRQAGDARRILPVAQFYVVSVCGLHEHRADEAAKNNSEAMFHRSDPRLHRRDVSHCHRAEYPLQVCLVLHRSATALTNAPPRR